MASHYRTNKYGEKIEVQLYCCGTCRNYEFEREDRDNYCSCYRCYYSVDDSCSRNWEKSDEVSSIGCYLTTACCCYKGLPDDCLELTLLRRFRDNVLCTTEVGRCLIKHYYETAPKLLEELNTRSENTKEEILSWTYGQIQSIAAMIEEDMEVNADEITALYIMLTLHFENKVRQMTS